MAGSTIRIDEQTRIMLKDYCTETGQTMSDAYRGFIREGIEHYKHNKELGYQQSIGKEGLMINQQNAIRASIETLALVRALVDDEAILANAINTTKRTLQDGWQYDRS